MCIAIGMLFPFDRLAVGLQTVSLRTQQLPDFGNADLKSVAIAFVNEFRLAAEKVPPTQCGSRKSATHPADRSVASD